MMASITATLWKCNLCSHVWRARKAGVPVRCAGCKSPYWNRNNETEFFDKGRFEKKLAEAKESEGKK